MKVSTTAYDIQERKWTLTIELPKALDLTLMQDGIIIEYPEWSLEEPLYLPKFTFRFHGTPTIIEDFGVIGEKTHSFTLTGVVGSMTFTWNGYLTDTLFNIPNTGYDEVVEVNGISDIEALKYRSWDMPAPEGKIPSIESTISTLLTDITKADIKYNLSFPRSNLGYARYNNWYDEEGIPMTYLDILKSVCMFFSLSLEMNYTTQIIIISSYSQLQKQNDNMLYYNSVKHRGLDETYSRSENWLSGIVVDKILKPGDILTNLSANTSIEPPYTYVLESYWRRHVGSIAGSKNSRGLQMYETHLHVIGKDEFPGWSFPHYTYSGQPWSEWWEPHFDGTQMRPCAGMYEVSYRNWQIANIINPAQVYPETPLTNMFLIKTWNRAGEENIYKPTCYDLGSGEHPWAVFKSEFTASENKYILFSGKIGFAERWGDPGAWEENG
jgi:hypothetical protein